MAISLEAAEQEIANALTQAGLSRPAGVLAVVMATRAHARPEDELVEIVRQYPSLEDSSTARRAIRDLLKRQWLETSISYALELTHQAPDLREKIENLLARPGVAHELLRMRASLEPFVRIVGPMKDEIVYSSFLELLTSAQKRICLPMLATTPYDETVKILKERAEAGVQIQLLLGSPSLVARWRGETMRKIAFERIERWQVLFRSYDNVDIRVSHHAKDMAIASSVGIDNIIARYDVYDPYSQRSLEGVMIEASSPQGMSLNIVRIFYDMFDDSWRRAQVAGHLSRIRWMLRRWWKIEFGAIVLLLAFFRIPVDHWLDIMIALGAGILAPSIVDEVPRLRLAIQEWRRS
jgi:hypothetical protein